MAGSVTDLDVYRQLREGAEAKKAMATAPTLSVWGEARPGLIVLHLPPGWQEVEMSPTKARVWLERLQMLIESAEALEREGD